MYPENAVTCIPRKRLDDSPFLAEDPLHLKRTEGKERMNTRGTLERLVKEHKGDGQMPFSGEEHISLAIGGTLCPGPLLLGHSIHQDEEHHTWIIDGTLITCTPQEYACLKELLEQAHRCVPFARLLNAFSVEYAEIKTARGRMRQVLSSLRTKLWPLGIEIISLRDVGYMLQANAQGVEQTKGKPDVH